MIIPDNNPKRQSEAEIRRENAFADSHSALDHLRRLKDHMRIDPFASRALDHLIDAYDEILERLE